MNIRVDLNTPIRDGREVVFRSPVDCSQITGLILYYPENGSTCSKEFMFADAHGNNVGDIDHLFAENVVVKVILDLDTSMAFVQNADTNAYLEGRFKDLEKQIGAGGGSGECVKKTDYATGTTAGVVFAHPTYGVTTNGSGLLYLYAPSEQEIKEKQNNYKPITPFKLDYAVKVGITTNTLTLTDEEMRSAQDWLGITALVGDIEAALDGIIAIQESLIGGEVQ